MKKLVTIVLLVIVISITTTCSTWNNNSRAQLIKPGMTFNEVYKLMGNPDIGWGLPQKGSGQESMLFYEIPGDRYVIVNFKGDVVSAPPISYIDKAGVIID